ncbi:MAG: hypothetical protein KDA44_23250 [Planctomycetales bacterium]|nr:hypothetical protein [Planctomycetales bacterium]
MQRIDKRHSLDEMLAADANNRWRRRGEERSPDPLADNGAGPATRPRREPSPRFEYDAPPTFAERIAWPLFLLSAWILFELTANATLSVLTACLKFGWNDFRTGLWLLRTDPEVPRARACCWFYIASGVWKTAIVPILAVLLVSTAWGLISARALPAAGGAAEHIWSALLVGLGASATLVLVVAAACFFALAAGVRVWVHPELHESRRHEAWPPEWHRYVGQHDNRGRAILATALIFVTLGFPPLVFRAVLLGFRGDLQVAVVLALVFGVPIGATATYAFLRGKIFADGPWQCWPESMAAFVEHLTGEEFGPPAPEIAEITDSEAQSHEAPFASGS